MNRSDIHSLFVKTFASEYHKPSIANANDLLKVEEALGTTFPQSYISFITTHGSVHTPTILDLVTGGESEVAPEGASFDIQGFLAVDQIIEVAEAHWSCGMPETIIPIASDCMGNIFGFTRGSTDNRPNDLSVMVFDHDFVTVEEEHSSFDEWLNSFLTIYNNQ